MCPYKMARNILYTWKCTKILIESYNHFVNSRTKKFGVLSNHQINVSSHTVQVVYWKFSKYVSKTFWWSSWRFLRFLFLFFSKQFTFYFLTICRPSTVLKNCLVKVFDFIIVYAFQNPTLCLHMIILPN